MDRWQCEYVEGGVNLRKIATHAEEVNVRCDAEAASEFLQFGALGAVADEYGFEFNSALYRQRRSGYEMLETFDRGESADTTEALVIVVPVNRAAEWNLSPAVANPANEAARSAIIAILRVMVVIPCAVERLMVTVCRVWRSESEYSLKSA